jgi:hypothetical protein
VNLSVDVRWHEHGQPRDDSANRGIVTAAAGGLCLPFPNYVFDKRDSSRFHNWADVGVYIWMGLGLIAIGLFAFELSFLVRGDMTD